MEMILITTQKMMSLNKKRIERMFMEIK